MLLSLGPEAFVCKLEGSQPELGRGPTSGTADLSEYGNEWNVSSRMVLRSQSTPPSASSSLFLQTVKILVQWGEKGKTHY